mmetsp:Transcript_24307/g.63476  ORF Transcript_24307/g.63476 Transcript_24307/m.63476 type:complete len:241 (-) Transcript_24307:737-1459(-)
MTASLKFTIFEYLPPGPPMTCSLPSLVQKDILSMYLPYVSSTAVIFWPTENVSVLWTPLFPPCSGRGQLLSPWDRTSWMLFSQRWLLTTIWLTWTFANSPYSWIIVPESSNDWPPGPPAPPTLAKQVLSSAAAAASASFVAVLQLSTSPSFSSFSGQYSCRALSMFFLLASSFVTFSFGAIVVVNSWLSSLSFMEVGTGCFIVCDSHTSGSPPCGGIDPSEYILVVVLYLSKNSFDSLSD